MSLMSLKYYKLNKRNFLIINVDYIQYFQESLCYFVAIVKPLGVALSNHLSFGIENLEMSDLTQSSLYLYNFLSLLVCKRECLVYQ